MISLFRNHLGHAPRAALSTPPLGRAPAALSAVGLGSLSAALSAAAFGCLLAASNAAAQSSRGLYVTLGVGLSDAAGVEAAISGINHPTRCDRLLYTDPAEVPTDPACTGNDSRLEGGYSFAPERGLGGGVAIGYSFGAVSAEIEVFQRHQVIQEAAFTVGATASDAIVGKDTEWSPLLPPWGDISEFRGRQIYANVYYRLDNPTPLTPYLGVGGGPAWTDYRWYAGFLRKSIAEGYLEAFGGSRTNPEASPEWQRRAAGTISQIDAFVSERGLGFQALGGLDYRFSEDLSLGVRVRWVHIPDIAIDQLWTTVRSHAPVHADGTTPFESRFDFTKLGYMAGGLTLRYRL